MTSLLSCLHKEFGYRRFDATDVYSRVSNNPLLVAALEAEVPRLRYKRGPMNTRAIRMALRRLPGLKTHHYAAGDYWQFYVATTDPQNNRRKLPLWWYENDDEGAS
jgi:hypothetical protein